MGKGAVGTAAFMGVAGELAERAMTWAKVNNVEGFDWAGEAQKALAATDDKVVSKHVQKADPVTMAYMVDKLVEYGKWTYGRIAKH
jgi:ribosomal protein S12 methylthiotransferase accessory factor YcaO